MLEITLPYPPTVNTYWGHTKTGHTYVTKKGKDFRKAVCSIVPKCKFEGAIHIDIEVWHPDNRLRDIDNLAKAIQDALQYAEVYEDDNQICYLCIRRMGVIEGGKVVVRVATAGSTLFN